MQLKLPSARWLLVMVLLVPPVWLVLWVAASRIVGVPVESAGELSGLLAAIGGIMGAIFTVGGLILALVAILSQITLEDRAKRVMEDKFSELAPELERRADRRIAGRIAFRDAQAALEAHDWGEAEAQAMKALAQYPDLPAARSTIALALAQAVEASFSYRLSGISDANVADMLALYRTGQRESPWYALEPPTAAAIEWLNDAYRHGDNPEGWVSAARALVYGANAAFDKMMEAVRDAMSINRQELALYLTMPDRLAMLIYACDNERNRIEAIGELLGIKLPASADAIRESVDAVGSVPYTDYVDWYAVERTVVGHLSRYVSKVRIFVLDDKPGGRTAQANIFTHGRQLSFIPSDSTQRLPVAELLDKLTAQLLFICPMSALPK